MYECVCGGGAQTYTNAGMHMCTCQHGVCTSESLEARDGTMAWKPVMALWPESP